MPDYFDLNNAMLARLLRSGALSSNIPDAEGLRAVRTGPAAPPPRNQAELHEQMESARLNGQQYPDPHTLNAHRGSSDLLPGGSLPPLPSQGMRPETSGIAMQPQSQGERDELAQDASSAGMAAQTALLSAVPVGRIVQGARAAANLIPRAVSTAPRTAATAAALATATAAPSEATPPQNPTAGPTEPGLMAEFLRMMGGKPDDQRPLTPDEFVQARRRMQPRDESTFIQGEIDKIRATERWQKGGQTLRANLENSARENARQAHAGLQRSIDAETRTLQNEYEGYRSGWEQQRTEQMNKGFVERHPNVALATTVAGPLLAGGMVHRGFDRYNRTMGDAARRTQDAMRSGNYREAASAASTADRLAEREFRTKLATAGFYSTIPADLRLAGDFVDKYALPPQAGARQDAERRMGDLGSYLRSMGGNVLSGGIGAMAGAGSSMLGRHAAAPAEARTAASHIAGLKGSPDQMARIIADRAATADRASARAAAAGNDLATARGTPPGGASDDRSWLARMLRSGRASNAPASSIPLTAASDAGQLRALPAPAPSPSRSSLASMLRREGARANADPSSTRRLPQGFQEDNRLRGSGVRGPSGRIASRPPSDDPVD